MKKKQYKAPTTMLVPLKMNCLLVAESMQVNSTQTVNDDNAVFSRGGTSWDWDENE